MIATLFPFRWSSSQNDPIFAEGIYYEHFGIEEGLPSTETYFAHQDELGNMWFTTDRGIVKYDGYEFNVYNRDDGLAELVNIQIRKDTENTFWVIGINGSLTYFNGKYFTPHPINEKLKYFFSNYYSNNSILDITSTHIFLSAFAKKNNKDFERIILKVKKDAPIFEEIQIELFNCEANTPISNLYKKIENDSIKTIGYYYFPLSQKIVFYSDSSFIFSENEMLKFIPVQSTATFLTITSKNSIFLSENKQTRVIPQDEQLFGNVEVSSIYESRSGYFWILTSNDGIYKIKPKSQFLTNNILEEEFRITRSFAKKDELAYLAIKSYKNNLFCFRQNENDIIQIPSPIYEHLDRTFSFIIDENIKIIHRHKKVHIIKDNNVISQPYITDIPTVEKLIQKTAPHCFLAATNDGIHTIRYIKQESRFITQQIKFIPSARYNDIIQLSDSLWMAGDINGNLIVFNSKRILLNYNMDFAAINCLSKIGESIFVGTNKGLVELSINEKFTQLTTQFLITIEEGLISNYITTLNLWDNFLYVGTTKGLQKINLKKYKRFNKSIRKPFINAIKSNLTGEHLLINNKILADSKIKSIKIQYSLIDHLRPSQISPFRFKLYNDLDLNPWVVTESREANFYNLAPGNYTFEVQYRDRSLQWSDSETISFSVLPHFTETTAFQLTILVIFSLAIMAIYYYISSRRIREQALVNEINEVKMKLSRQQLNPHFIYNALNALQNFIFKDQKEEANRYLKKLSTLIRESLEFSELEELPLRREVSFMQRYLELEKSRYPDRFDYEIKTNVDPSIKEPKVPSLLVQTLAENAIKHGFKNIDHKGLLSIEYNCPSATETSIIVEDNGQGFDGVYDSEGFGLKLIKRRIQIYNNEHKTKQASLAIKYQNGDVKSGCRVHIHIKKTPL